MDAYQVNVWFRGVYAQIIIEMDGFLKLFSIMYIVMELHGFPFNFG